MRERLKRTSEMPEFAHREALRRMRYPRSSKLSLSGLTLRWRRSKPERVGLFLEENFILRRELFAWLHHDEDRVGAFQLFTFDAAGCYDNKQFFDVMDLDASIEMRLADAVCSSWKELIDDVSIWAPIAEFRSAWIRPDFAGGRLFEEAAETVISGLGRYSILALLAFPLEYEGEATPNLEPALAARKAAMMRYYRKSLKVRPLPGLAGKAGWMWRAHPQYADLISSPRASKRRYKTDFA